MLYKCNKVTLIPPDKLIRYTYGDGYKESIMVDECLSAEIVDLWNNGVQTLGCCCGHGRELGFIQVELSCVEKMKELGYVHYIYPDRFGDNERLDAFIPKTYGHKYDGYTDWYLG